MVWEGRDSCDVVLQVSRGPKRRHNFGALGISGRYIETLLRCGQKRLMGCGSDVGVGDLLRSAFNVREGVLHADEECMQSAIEQADDLRDLSERKRRERERSRKVSGARIFPGAPHKQQRV
jgi:hypothetical protein